MPPKLISYKDLCPPPNCPSTNCSDVKCKETQVNLYDLVKHFEMKPFIGTHYVGLQNRTLGKCKRAYCRKSVVANQQLPPTLYNYYYIFAFACSFSIQFYCANFATSKTESKPQNPEFGNFGIFAQLFSIFRCCFFLPLGDFTYTK